MSLQVWLPLNGDLHNLGLSDISFNNENSTTIIIDNNGKIGQCYTRSTAVTVGRIISDKNILLDGDLSMCCWAKVIATVGDTANGLITNHSHSDNTGFGITVKLMTNTDYRISCNTGNGSGRTYNTYYGTTNIKNQWHHLALTYKSNIHQFLLWVDGKVELTLSYTNSAKTDKICIFDWSTTYNSSSYHPACSLNDVRIYDHALSAKEVEEIAKGLILHYKLDDAYLESTTNLLANQNLSAAGLTVTTTSTYSNNILIVTTTSRIGSYTFDTFRISIPQSILISGTQYALSFKYKILSGDGDLYLERCDWCDSNFVNINKKVYSDGYEVKLKCPIKNYDNTYHFFDVYMTAPNTLIQFWDFLLEAKDHATPYVNGTRTSTTIYDSSGCSNNGTIIGSLEIVNDSLRYSCATKFNGSSAIKVNNNNWMAQGASELTVNIWAYMDNWSSWNGNRLYSCTEGGGFNIENTIANSLTFPVCVYTNTAHSATGYIPTESRVAILKTDLTSGWHMFTYIYTETECQCYLDGVLYLTKPYTSYGVYFNINGSRLFLGCEANGVNPYSPYFIGQESDFRIYYTALTSEQIKELYNTSMSIDNNGNIHARELVEL